nr:hypothetical protein Itr_chr14CG10990 [Ipomoea trifida]
MLERRVRADPEQRGSSRPVLANYLRVDRKTMIATTDSNPEPVERVPENFLSMHEYRSDMAYFISDVKQAGGDLIHKLLASYIAAVNRVSASGYFD